MVNDLPKLYTELADWWPILLCSFRPQTMLELGASGGNNASHLKRHFETTLVDLSPGMLAVTCENYIHET